MQPACDIWTGRALPEKKGKKENNFNIDLKLKKIKWMGRKTNLKVAQWKWKVKKERERERKVGTTRSSIPHDQIKMTLRQLQNKLLLIKFMGQTLVHFFPFLSWNTHDVKISHTRDFRL